VPKMQRRPIFRAGLAFQLPEMLPVFSYLEYNPGSASLQQAQVSGLILAL
jgi:phage tail protein X